jgi:hypothetical protein
MFDSDPVILAIWFSLLVSAACAAGLLRLCVWENHRFGKLYAIFHCAVPLPIVFAFVPGGTKVSAVLGNLILVGLICLLVAVLSFSTPKSAGTFFGLGFLGIVSFAIHICLLHNLP